MTSRINTTNGSTAIRFSRVNWMNCLIRPGAIVAQASERRERDVDDDVRDRLHRLEHDEVRERVDAVRASPKNLSTTA